MAVDRTKILYPLSEFYRESGTSLPEFEIVDGDTIPEPYRQLLVHNDDMTSVLQDYHNQAIRLRLIELFEEPDRILRKVALLREDGRPVESGAIEINLQSFPDKAREDIRSSHLPLGAILKKYTMEYTSQPMRFFKIKSDEFIGKALNLSESHQLYGRTNELTNSNGELLARVVEILPPLEPEGLE